jgi:hypothetical protein
MRKPLACLLLIAGCGGSANHTKSCTDVATAQCQKLMTCSTTDLNRRYGSVDVCVMRGVAECLNTFKAPQNTNSDSKLESCAAAVPAQDCNDFLSGINTLPQCLPANGPRADGDPCAFSGQCMTGWCSITTGSNCGVCAEVPAEGDDCTMTTCGGRGLICAGGGACATPIAVGAACDKNAGIAPCVQGASCVGTQAGGATCQTNLTTVGATPCDVHTKTAPDCAHADGLYCVSTTMACATLQVAADGMPCGYVNDVFYNCQNGSTCFGSMGTTTPGTCIAPAADGAACDSVNGPGCLVPARCVGTETDGGATGTCQLPGSQSCG